MLVKVMAVAKPQVPRATRRTKLRPADVERSVKHAQNLCYGYEDTPACKVAWDRVEELSAELARQREEAMCIEDPAACREYDV